MPSHPRLNSAFRNVAKICYLLPFSCNTVNFELSKLFKFLFCSSKKGSPTIRSRPLRTLWQLRRGSGGAQLRDGLTRATEGSAPGDHHRQRE